MRYRTSIPVAVVFACLLPAAVQAGAIFLPGRLAEGKFVADQGANAPCYAIPYSTATASVDGNMASVRLQETVAGPEKVLETVCIVPLPEGADGRGAVVSAGVPNGDRAVLPAARFLDTAEAQKLYEAVARGLDSVKILALSGRPALLVADFRLQGKIEVTVEYQQKIHQQGGLYRLECPMPAVAFARGPVARLSANVTIAGDEPLRAVFSPTHAATIDRQGLNQATARIKSDNWSGTDDLRLVWVADRDDLGLRVLACRLDAEEDGYFMLVGNPTGAAAAERSAEKDVIFVLDTSGSMRGEKIEQARAAIDYCLGQLSAGDRFNIVTFGTEAARFRDAPVICSQEVVAAAREYIDSVVAKGETNINGALGKALAIDGPEVKESGTGSIGAPKNSPEPPSAQPSPGGRGRESRSRIVIFLTDGTPTADELVPEKIVANVKKANQSGARIFVMGLGHDVNAHLLDNLAEVTDGSSEYMAPGEEIDAKVAALYDRLAHPVLTDVEVKFGRLQTNSVYPQKLAALFRGSEVMVFGRYRGGGKHTFAVSGKLGDKQMEHVCTAYFPEKPEEGGNDFVASLWASRKIGYLLQEIRLHGANDELIGEVVRLSKRFGIVTEYTEFLATAAADMDAPAAVVEAKRRMAEAGAQQAGKWAVNQAFNDRQLQNRAVASQEANTFRDRRGNVVSADNIRQVGRRVFYLRDRQWVDGEDAGNRKVRIVKLDDPKYRDLVRSNRDFAQAQQLGWAVSLNIGDERVIVEKNGQQKDEQLRRQTPTLQQQDFEQQTPMNQMQQFRNQAPRQMNQMQEPGLQQNQAPRKALQPAPPGKEARDKTSMKGWEVRIWKKEDTTWFSLLPGTNRVKTEGEIDKSAVKGFEAIKPMLDQIQAGQTVTIQGRRATGAPPKD